MIRITGEMSIYRAAELKPVLLQALADGGAAPLAIDLSQVSEFDSAGLQLLMATARAAADAGTALRLHAPSPAVQEVLALLDLTRCFDTIAAGATA